MHVKGIEMTFADPRCQTNHGSNLCPFVSAPTRYFRLTQMAQLIEAVTGWDFSSYGLMRIGERRNVLMRFYNCREAFSAAADTLPERFYDEPIRSGRHQGARIDKAKFEEMLWSCTAAWSAGTGREGPAMRSSTI